MRIKYEVIYRAWNHRKGDFWKTEGDYSTGRHARKHARKLIGKFPLRAIGFLTEDDVQVVERLEEFAPEGMLVTPGDFRLRVRTPVHEIPYVEVRDEGGRGPDGYADFVISIRTMDLRPLHGCSEGPPLPGEAGIDWPGYNRPG